MRNGAGPSAIIAFIVPAIVTKRLGACKHMEGKRKQIDSRERETVNAQSVAMHSEETN